MKRIVFIALALLLTACHPLLSKIHVVDIQQGNKITQAQIQQLHAGMSREQVSDLLGDPILRNTFDGERWDYVYSLEKSGRLVDQQHLSVYFNNAGTVTKFTQNAH